MAELDVGSHCSLEECKQLDFLPITCSSCGLVFCKEHSFMDRHPCSRSKISATSEPIDTFPKSFPCDFEGCSNRELTKVVCGDCKHNFCLQHRHSTDHACEGTSRTAAEARMSKTAQHVREILSSKQQSPTASVKPKKMSKKAKATAAKVGLMKLKMKASGNKGIPDVERIYLQVLLPKTSKLCSKAMFFSKQWSVGRIIDVIAEEVGLRNENDVAGAHRLRLFDTNEGEILRTDRALEAYVSEDRVYSGGDVILEYIKNDIDHLEHYSEYK